MVFSLGRKEKSEERVSIKSEVASSVVILANPDLGLRDLGAKLADLQDRGYDLNQRLRGTPFGVSSIELGNFVGRLEMGGYMEGNFVNASSLGEEGVDLFEIEILEHYLAGPEIIQRFADDAGLDLIPIFQKHIGRYLSLREIHPSIFFSLSSSLLSP